MTERLSCEHVKDLSRWIVLTGGLKKSWFASRQVVYEATEPA